MKRAKYYIFLFAIIFSVVAFFNFRSTGSAPDKDKEILFIEDSFETALTAAKAKHKYIFVDAFTTWCGPCKQLKKTTFKDRQVADFFNKNFINISIDVEKGRGIELAEKWEVLAYPTLLILDSDGNVILRSIGFLDADQLISFGKQTLQKNKQGS